MRSFLRDFFRGSALVLFFIVTLLISAQSTRVFVSPDENAAFYFARLFAETGSLTASVPLNQALDNFLHPRSVVALNGLLLPGGFIGLPLLTGTLMWLYGDVAALLFTPFLALLAVLAWRSVIKHLFSDSLLADLSAFFLMIHPAFLYYSGRVMMNNVAFVVFLIFAAWFFVRRPFRKIETHFAPELRQLECLLGGIMVGLALFVRTAELTWVAVGFVMLLVIYRARLGWRNIAAAMIGLGFMCAVIGGTNALVYGSPLSTGYTMQAEIGAVTDSTIASLIPTLPSQVFSFLFPFGIHERSVLRHAWQYGVYLYPWMTILSLLGFAILCVRMVPRQTGLGVRIRVATEWRLFMGMLVMLAIWLGLVYGSWNFFDNPDPKLITLGNSYVRYWLPVFVLSSVFAAYGLVTLYRWLKNRWSEKSWWRWLVDCLIALVLFVSTLVSLNLVLFGADGILPTRTALDSFVGKRMSILSRTEPDSIIIVDRADKYLFPDRQVVVPLRDERTYAMLSRMTAYAPLYYFGITLPEKDIDYLQTTYLLPQGLTIDLVATINEESLYRIHARVAF